MIIMDMMMAKDGHIDGDDHDHDVDVEGYRWIMMMVVARR